METKKELSEKYKWVVLSNTTLGVLMATIDQSIMLIALPDIFRGIKIDPLIPGNSFYLLWMILSFMVVTSVLVVAFGRLGDMYGRVRMYNLGFAVYTFFSLLLTITWMSGTSAAIWLIVMRVFQGVGAALLMANSAAILTDAFPENQRGMAIGINQVAGKWYFPPRSHEVAAATRQAMIEKLNAVLRPSPKGFEIRFGKKLFPTNVEYLLFVKVPSTWLPTMCLIGLCPKKAAKSIETGGR